jgi:superfamily I DNA/RNA helicase
VASDDAAVLLSRQAGGGTNYFEADFVYLPNMDLFMALFTNTKTSGLSDCEIAANLGRLVQMLQAFDTFWMTPLRLRPVGPDHTQPQPRPKELARVLTEFGVQDKRAGPMLKIGGWCTDRRKEMERWARSGAGGATAALRRRMAELLWGLGESHFPMGVRSVPVGARPWDKPLAVLDWWRQLPAEDAHEALSHAEAALSHADPHTGQRAWVQLGKHDAHAALSCALLSSRPFRDLAAAITSTESLDVWQRAAATCGGAAPVRIEAGPGAGKTRTITARCVHIMASVAAAAAAAAHAPGAGSVPMLRAEDVVAVTFTRAAAGGLREKLCELRVPCPTVSTMDAFLMSLVADVRRRARLAPLAWLVTTRKDREAQLRAKTTAQDYDAEAAANLAEGRCCEEMLIVILRGGAAGVDPRALYTDAEATALAPAAMALLNSMTRAYRTHSLFSWAAPPAAAVAAVADDILHEWTPKQLEALARVAPLHYTPPARGSGSVEGVVQRTHLGHTLRAFAAAVAALETPTVPVATWAFDKELLVLALLGRTRVAGAQPWTRSADVTAAVAAVRALASRKHFVIDEFQDTSPAQLRVFADLAAPPVALRRRAAGAAAVAGAAATPCVSRLTCVGDSDQSVYGFRGASSAALDAAFRVACPSAGPPLPLLLNYRSTPHIVAACTALIAPNYEQAASASASPSASALASAAPAQKALRAKRTDGLPVRLVRCESAGGELEHVLTAVRAWRAVGVPLHDIAVLFRQRPFASGMDAFIEHMKQHSFFMFALLQDAAAAAASADGGDASGSASAAAPVSAAGAPSAAAYGKIAVGTIHAAKGLEWRIVFVVGACAGAALNISNAAKRATAAAANELTREERRVMYVALSRARELLHVTYVKPGGGGVVPFVEELLHAQPHGCVTYVELGPGDGGGREHEELAADVAGLARGAEDEARSGDTTPSSV